METTLIILKPDTVQRGLMGQVFSRFERKGLTIVGAKLIPVSLELAEKHYGEHKGKDFYPGLLKFITRLPVMVIAVRGTGSVQICRKMIGATHGAEAEIGTIRGDYSMSNSLNMVHGSDSVESAERELALWFDEGEIIDYDRTVCQWIDNPAQQH